MGKFLSGNYYKEVENYGERKGNVLGAKAPH